jgi:hypothetical protein
LSTRKLENPPQLRSYLAIALLVVLSGPVLVKTGVVLDYWMNYTYYKEVLCENKDIPMKNCNGKCAVSKQIKKAEDAKSQAESNLPMLSKSELGQFLPTSSETILTCDFYTNPLEHHSRYVGMRSEIKVSAIFHPPLQG